VEASENKNDFMDFHHQLSLVSVQHILGLPPDDQPRWAQSEKVQCAAAQKEDFFSEEISSPSFWDNFNYCPHSFVFF